MLARRTLVATLALFAVLLVACARPVDQPTASPSASPTTVAGSPSPGASPTTSPATTPDPSASLSPGASASPGPLPSPVTGCPLPQPLPTYPPGYTDANGQNVGGTVMPHPLCPALPNGPVEILAWLFTPIFQAMFMALVGFYLLVGDIGIAIILLTILIKTLLIPLFRRQIVAQRRTQLLQPEIRAIQLKYKGNRTKISEETMRLYQERGVNPAAGCLPMVLQLFLLLPIYQVVSQGLAATDISSMLQVFGTPVLEVACQAPGTLQPCIDTNIWWLGGLDAHLKSVINVFGFELSLLAIVAAFLQLIQTRMMTPQTTDPQVAAQQRVLIFLPLLLLFWGFLPAGLFIYWIVFSAYSIVQQYFIAGWGSLFPLFGWTPGFARDHTPRFPVEIPQSKRPPKDSADGTPGAVQDKRSPSDRAAGTIRSTPKRGRTSRRGRRR